MSEETIDNLPDGWRWASLKELCLPVKNSDPRLNPESKFIYIDIGSIDSSTKRITKPKTLFGKEAPSRAKQIVKAGDILVSTTRPNLNAVAQVSAALEGQVCSTGFCVLRPDPSLLDSNYLFGFVRSEEFIKSLADLVNGALYPAVTDKQVFAQQIPLAPLEEQQMIAAQLNAQLENLETVRVAAEAQLETLRMLPAALLRAAFSTTVTKEFNATPPPPPPHGIIQFTQNKQWPYVLLGAVCTINPRRTAKLERTADALTTFVPMPAVDDRNGIIVRPEVKQYQEVRKGYTYFEEGDVLFAKITPCMQNGKHAIARNLLDSIGFGSTEFHVLRPGDQVTAEWVHYFVRQESVLEGAAAHFEGSVGQQRVPAEYLRTLQIPLPPMAEQRRLTALLQEQLAATDEARTAAEAQLVTLRTLPSALLRQLFAPALASA